jgi:hypothetical protein
MSKKNVDKSKAMTLKSLVVLISEADMTSKKEDGEDSLDNQIDKYLVDYEVEAKVSKNEGKDFRMMVRRFLSEAEEDESEDEKKDKLKTEDIDVESFVNSVMRLVDNYDSLLEVRNTILRRAVNFLVEGYEPDVAQSFKDLLLDSYGLEIGKSKSEVEDEEFQAPAAERAGTSPGA